MGLLKTATVLVRGAAVMLIAALCAGAAFADALDLPVPKIAIYPGEVLTENSLTQRAFNAEWTAKMPVHKSGAELIGKVARRTLLPGQPIPINATRVPDAVTQGKTYRIEFRDSGLVISGMAVALTSGAVGDLISLRNPDSGVIVRGMVTANGTVQVSTR